MRTRDLIGLLFLGLVMLTGCRSIGGGPMDRQAAATIDHEVDLALQRLYASEPSARILARSARGILVFPSVFKAGFIGGIQYGKGGALRERGGTTGYYNIAAGSYGLQAGIQTFDYALFFMTRDALDYLKSSRGWEIGVGPNIVVVDTGVAKSLTTTTAKEDVYAFIFGQKGLMAGVGLQGSKITQINP